MKPSDPRSSTSRANSSIFLFERTLSEPTRNTPGVTSAEVAAVALRKSDSRSRSIRLAFLVCLAFVLVVRNAGSGGEPVVATLVVIALALAGLGLVLRFDRARLARRLPAGVVAQAAAVARGSGVVPSGSADQVMKAGRSIVGRVIVAGTGIAWQPARRSQERGAQVIALRWSDIRAVSWAPRSGTWIRAIVRVEAFAFDTTASETLIVSITSPQAIHAALETLGVLVTAPGATL